MTEIRISFIIPMYNEAESIGRCLTAILAEAEPGDEVIVVDNGSTDGSPEIARRYPGVTVTTLPERTIAAVRNHGAAQAGGDILGFIDADCLVNRGWRRQVTALLGTPGEIVAVGAKCLVPDDAGWIETAWYAQKTLTRKQVKYINSGNFAIRRNVFLAVGGFDESLVTGEDSELGWRLHNMGYTLLEEPEVGAVHLGNPKKLGDFYRKEKWRGLGMFGTFRVSRFDKPLIMTVLFGAGLAVGVPATFRLLGIGAYRSAAAVGAAALGWAPLATAIYRYGQFRTGKYLPALLPLYFVYYTARTQALLELLAVGLRTGQHGSRKRQP
jgi:glycosyltransferase involved in cell wall biosynthesis